MFNSMSISMFNSMFIFDFENRKVEKTRKVDSLLRRLKPIFRVHHSPLLDQPGRMTSNVEKIRSMGVQDYFEMVCNMDLET